MPLPELPMNNPWRCKLPAPPALRVSAIRPPVTETAMPMALSGAALTSHQKRTPPASRGPCPNHKVAPHVHATGSVLPPTAPRTCGAPIPADDATHCAKALGWDEALLVRECWTCDVGPEADCRLQEFRSWPLGLRIILRVPI
ncbi:unnamed protein product [Cuscuta campestris]|uniref:Uncharacterized protein n=1 Tax=Cuscuta campestris TaxID=132261 RepID=A0A484MRT9_9ASTE|nr:unnamed protein product [Cuscuta campestris]